MTDLYTTLQPILPTLWVVWFFVLFTGIILYVMAPWRKRSYEQQGEIPLRDDESQARLRRDPAGQR